jgi:hypothetical protein
LSHKGLAAEAEGALSDDFLELYDPEITAEQLLAAVYERLEKRRRLPGYSPASFPVYAAVTPQPEMPLGLPYRTNLYHHLRQANRLYCQVETGPQLGPSTATQLPLVGRLWKLIREQAHSLVLFYVNRHVTAQVNVNRHLVSVLNEITVLCQEQQRRIGDLEEEVRILRQQVDRE